MSKFCLVMKIADAIVSVTCESIYIRNYSLDMSKEANYEANALFILNIIFGVCTIIIELSTIFVRRAILRKIDDEDVIDGEQQELHINALPKKDEGGIVNEAHKHSHQDHGHGQGQ